MKGNYHPLKDLSQEDQTILSELCSSGSSDKRLKFTHLTFASTGVMKFLTQLYWKNPQARLNYELTFLVKCQGGLAPFYISYLDDAFNLIFLRKSKKKAVFNKKYKKWFTSR